MPSNFVQFAGRCTQPLDSQRAIRAQHLTEHRVFVVKCICPSASLAVYNAFNSLRTARGKLNELCVQSVINTIQGEFTSPTSTPSRHDQRAAQRNADVVRTHHAGATADFVACARSCVVVSKPGSNSAFSQDFGLA